ncbi:hypothetical protein PRO82_001629 [Candidatus Protochlamydia amoebophila]|nr:hypothetical protein [Candidatus Protochlamydia amoebophila]
MIWSDYLHSKHFLVKKIFITELIKKNEGNFPEKVLNFSGFFRYF